VAFLAFVHLALFLALSLSPGKLLRFRMGMENRTEENEMAVVE